MQVFPVGDERLLLHVGGRDVECSTFGLPADQVKGIAVICHPHPLFGGAMDNKVVHTLWRAFKSVGINALRFNFRGVGGSDGEHDNGVGETEDLAGIIAWLAAQFPGKPIYLAGFPLGLLLPQRMPPKVLARLWRICFCWHRQCIILIWARFRV
ncbi:MAG: hypothetical protein JKY01_01440 [Pseudomonadales bacterium]|nr:hypothetical protein [Pseudomonadales bacterium]